MTNHSSFTMFQDSVIDVIGQCTDRTNQLYNEYVCAEIRGGSLKKTMDKAFEEFADDPTDEKYDQYKLAYNHWTESNEETISLLKKFGASFDIDVRELNIDTTVMDMEILNYLDNKEA